MENDCKEENTDYLKIPDLGETGKIELVKWYISKNMDFAAGDELCDLVTDKAVFSLEAPYSGRILEILIPEKSIVQKEENAAMVRIAR